jgi:hypothetical protein
MQQPKNATKTNKDNDYVNERINEKTRVMRVRKRREMRREREWIHTFFFSYF